MAEIDGDVIMNPGESLQTVAMQIFARKNQEMENVVI
jgi:hypothetical protein